MNVIAPLVELEAYQFPLVQSCLYPKMVSTCDDVRKASAYAEKELDSHFLMCRFSFQLYHFLFCTLSAVFSFALFKSEKMCWDSHYSHEHILHIH